LNTAKTTNGGNKMSKYPNYEKEYLKLIEKITFKQISMHSKNLRKDKKSILIGGVLEK
jgi:hypothetical protein